jgi:hypothetical protein
MVGVAMERQPSRSGSRSAAVRAQVSALTKRTGYSAWLAWYLGEGPWKPYGRRNPKVRPNIPKVIPAAWWLSLRTLLKKRSKPAPSPAPTHERQASVFAGRGLFVTADDSQPRHQLVLRAKASGFHWITEQYGSRHWGETYDACRQLGLRAFVWDEAPTRSRASALGGCDGYIAQAEGTAAEVADALGGLASQVPRAIVTNLNPSRTDPAFDAAMLALGVACIVECYPPADPAASTRGMVEEARWRGYQEVFPVVGCYDGVPLAAYGCGNDFSIWASDTISHGDWAAVEGAH